MNRDLHIRGGAGNVALENITGRQGFRSLPSFYVLKRQ